MKRLLPLLLAAATCTAAAAQNVTAYFMEGATQRSQFNPAFAPLRGYVNIPGLGDLSLSTDGNLALGDLVYPTRDGLRLLVDPSVPASTALAPLSERNRLTGDLRTSLIGFGSFTGRDRTTFWSFDLSARTIASIDLPYGLFEFFKTGRDADIRNLSLAAQAWIEAGFNYSRPVTDRIYVGGRIKFLAGAARASATVQRLRLSMGEDRWYASAEGDLDLYASGLDVPTRPSDGGGAAEYLFDEADFGFKGPAGYGGAIDLGVTYNPLHDLQLSLAFTDLGFLSWGSANAIRGRLDKEMTFTGAEIDADGTADFDFNFDDVKFLAAEPRRHRQMLPWTMNLGAEYDVWRRKVGFGLLYSLRAYEFQTLHNLTASVNYRPARWFSLTGSYSFVRNRGRSLGIGLNLCPGGINLLLATDLLLTEKTPQWVPVKANRANVSLSLGVPIGPRGARVDAYRLRPSVVRALERRGCEVRSAEDETDRQKRRAAAEARRNQKLVEKASRKAARIIERAEESLPAGGSADRRTEVAKQRSASYAQAENDKAARERAARLKRIEKRMRSDIDKKKRE